MKAMVLNKICNLHDCSTPLTPMDLPEPSPGPDEILVKINACGVCHTELDEIEGRTPPPFFPVVPGHQVVGQVVECGQHAKEFTVTDRVGVDLGGDLVKVGELDFARPAASSLALKEDPAILRVRAGISILVR